LTRLRFGAPAFVSPRLSLLASQTERRVLRARGRGVYAQAPKATHGRGLFKSAKETGIYHQYCELIQKLSKLAGERRKRLIRVNVTGAIAAIALDMRFPWQITKAFALIGRTLGVMGHIAAEIRNPMAAQIDAAIKQAIVYEPDRT
jgi:citrate synthase